MPNIMLTYRCNLSCPYCFANEFVNQTSCDITPENFYKAVDFCAGQPGTHIGLIGGEPTLHPQLKEFIHSLAENPNVADIMVYTNGMRLDRLLPLCQDPTVGPILKILVNCNSPAVTGQKSFDRLVENLDLAFGKYNARANIKFGVNLYNNDFDYGYIKTLLTRYDQYQVRFSLTVPDFGVCGRTNPVKDFRGRKDFLLRFFHEMDEIGVLPYYDCNKVPNCIWTEEEWAWLCWYRNKYSSLPTNILDDAAKCAPVLDILPDLRAVRCFGMSDVAKENIADFASAEDLKAYFRNRIDAEACRVCSSPECRDCYDRKTGYCYGGCLGYKYDRIERANAAVEALN